MLRVTADPARPDQADLSPLVALLRRGGVVAIPTDTLYGLAADPCSPAAVRQIFTVKRRPAERAVPLIASSLAQVRASLGDLSDDGARLAARFWPGPLTLLLPTPQHLAPEVTGDGPTVGVRVPAHAAVCALAEAFGAPITATSANISGEAPTADPDEVARQLGDALDGLLDAGVLAGGLPSTIVDDTSRPARLVRAGAVPWEEIEACLRA